MEDNSVHENDIIWFRIPFAVYWIGRYGGLNLLCLYRKFWDSKEGRYYFKLV